MQGNRGADTRAEVALRSALHGRGLRFLKNARPIPSIRCRADIVFRGPRVAVFCDGCFWHRCPDHGRLPRTNESYWRAKLDRNVQRDRRNDGALQEAGWHVIRVWEHESATVAATRVETALRAARKARAASAQSATS